MTNDIVNQFDRKLHNNKDRIHSDTHEALVYVHDTLEFCISSAKTHFGEDVSPEIILGIYDRVVQRTNDYRERERRIDAKLVEFVEQRDMIERLGKAFGTSDDS